MRRLALAASLLLALLAVYYGLQRRENAAQERETEAKQLVRMSLDDTRTVTIVRQTHRPAVVKFERRGDRWWIVTPEKYRANQATVSGLVNQFDEKAFEKSFAADGLRQFGLEPAPLVVTFETEAGSETVFVGNKTPVDGNYYVLRSGDPEVAIVSSGFTYNLEKTLDDYRDKDVFWDFPETLTAIAFTVDDERWRIERRGEAWYAGDVSLAADKVDPLVTRIRSMRIRDHVAAGTLPEAARVTTHALVAWGDDGKPHALQFGGKKEENQAYYVRIVERDEWATVSDYVYDNLWPRPDALAPEPPEPATADSGSGEGMSPPR